MNLMIRILANVGLVIALYLVMVSGGVGVGGEEWGGVLGCGPGLGCDVVLGSSWSRWFGVPVVWFAVCVYGVVLCLSWLLWRRGGLRLWGWGVLLLLGMLLLGGGVWFVGVQVFVLGAICRWCMVEHGVGLVLGVLLLKRASIGYGKLIEPKWAMGVLLLAGLLLSVLIGGQVLGRSDGTALVRVSGGAGVVVGDAGEIPGVREVRLLNGRVRLRPDALPMMGSADAAHILLLLFDYNCSHCRKLHEHLELAIERYGDDQIGVVLLPVPLESECNAAMVGFDAEPRFEFSCEIAKLAMGVYHRNAQKYALLDGWMFDADRVHEGGRDWLVIADVYGKASELLGLVELESAMNDAWAEQRIAANVKLYELLGGGTIPKLLFGDVVLPGRRGTAEGLFSDLEAELGVRVKGGE